ncbi:MAG: hypothetical protein ACXW3Z_04645 [Limisphaerales bacterium]
MIELDQSLSLDELRDFAAVPIDPEEERYARPLEAHARKMSKAIGNQCEVVLLGSISTNKYAEPLMAHFGERLLFPASFVGRGDMSRGGLLLRCVAEGRELEYVPVSGAIRRGKRPEKLKARSWGYKIHEGATPIPK